MSNYLAIATVTALLQQLVQVAAQETEPGVRVRVKPPTSTPPKTPEIYLYLYQVAPNPSLRNAALPSRNHNGGFIDKPQVALDLYYLIAFSGDKALSTDRMLGATVAALAANPVLTREQIQRVVRKLGRSDSLAGSNLARQPELVKLTPLFLNLEELSKLWTVFFQTTHRISLSYVASVVLVDSQVAVQQALPSESIAYSLVTAASRGGLSRVSPGRINVVRSDLFRVRAEMSGDAKKILVGGQPADLIRVGSEYGLGAFPDSLTAGNRSLKLTEASVSNELQFALQPHLVDRLCQKAVMVPQLPLDGSTIETNSRRIETIQVEALPVLGARQVAELWLNQITKDALPGSAIGLSPLSFALPASLRDTLRKGPVKPAWCLAFAESGIHLSASSALQRLTPTAWCLGDVTFKQKYLIQVDEQGLTAFYGYGDSLRGASHLAFGVRPGLPAGRYLARLQVDREVESPLYRGYELLSYELLRHGRSVDSKMIQRLLAKRGVEVHASCTWLNLWRHRWLLSDYGNGRNYDIRLQGRTLSIHQANPLGWDEKLFVGKKVATAKISMPCNPKSLLVDVRKHLSTAVELSEALTAARLVPLRLWLVSDLVLGTSFLVVIPPQQGAEEEECTEPLKAKGVIFEMRPALVAEQAPLGPRVLQLVAVAEPTAESIEAAVRNGLQEELEVPMSSRVETRPIDEERWLLTDRETDSTLVIRNTPLSCSVFDLSALASEAVRIGVVKLPDLLHPRDRSQRAVLKASLEFLARDAPPHEAGRLELQARLITGLPSQQLGPLPGPVTITCLATGRRWLVEDPVADLSYLLDVQGRRVRILRARTPSRVFLGPLVQVKSGVST